MKTANKMKIRCNPVQSSITSICCLLFSVTSISIMGITFYEIESKQVILISIHRRRKEKTKFQTLRYWLDNSLPAAWDRTRASSLRNGYSFNLSPYIRMRIFTVIFGVWKNQFYIINVLIFLFRICWQGGSLCNLNQ